MDRVQLMQVKDEETGSLLASYDCQACMARKRHEACIVLMPCPACGEHENLSFFEVKGRARVTRRQNGEVSRVAHWAESSGWRFVQDYLSEYIAGVEGLPSVLVQWDRERAVYTPLVPLWLGVLLDTGTKVRRGRLSSRLPAKWPRVLARAGADLEFRGALAAMCTLDILGGGLSKDDAAERVVEYLEATW